MCVCRKNKIKDTLARFQLRWIDFHYQINWVSFNFYRHNFHCYRQSSSSFLLSPSSFYFLSYNFVTLALSVTVKCKRAIEVESPCHENVEWIKAIFFIKKERKSVAVRLIELKALKTLYRLPLVFRLFTDVVILCSVRFNDAILPFYSLLHNDCYCQLKVGFSFHFTHF